MTMRTEPSPFPRMAANAANTSGVAIAKAGVTSRIPGAPRRPWSGVTRSPRPSIRAGPPAAKNGTSDPIPAATAKRAWSSSSAPHSSSTPSRAAAASDDPPPRPAATGMRFSSRAATAGAGPGPPAQPPPTARRAAATARRTRLSWPSPTGNPVTCRVSSRGIRRSQAEPVGEGEGHEHRVEVVVAVVPTADDRQGQVELGGGDPDDRGQPSGGVTARRIGRGDPRRSGRSPPAGRATPPPRASAAAGRDRCRSPRARR